MRRRFDPTLAQVEFMIEMSEGGPRSITELARDAGRAMPVVSRWIRILEHRKMIELDRSEQRRKGGRAIGFWVLSVLGREFVETHPVTHLPRIVASASVDLASVAKPDGYFPFAGAQTAGH